MTHSDEDAVFDQITGEWDEAIPDLLTVQFHPNHATPAMVRVLDLNLIECFAVAIAHLETIPPSGNHRCESHGLAANFEAQDFLHPSAIHPCR